MILLYIKVLNLLLIPRNVWKYGGVLGKYTSFERSVHYIPKIVMGCDRKLRRKAE